MAYVQNAKVRFCGRSCSAKWRMRQPEHLAKVHNPAVAAKRAASKAAWFAAGSPAAERERARIAALNPMAKPETRAKVSRRLKEIGHKVSVRGGNGHGLTEPQRALMDALPGNWIAEYSLSLGRRTPGFPTAYKIDLADRGRKVAIEVDGHSHRSRKDQDAKKDAVLTSLGWTVLRFWNWDILNWIASGRPTESSISTTLARHGIQVFPSTAG